MSNNLFEQVLYPHLKKRALKDDEYIDEKTGKYYCKKCATPREASFEMFGKIYNPYVMCECEKLEEERLEKEKRELEFLKKVEELKEKGLQDKSLYDYCFANDKGYNKQLRHAYRYASKWDFIKENNIGLLLTGDVGTGKSFFAGCIANALIEKGIPVLMTNFARILNNLTGKFAFEKNEYLDILNSYSLLIIDDLGAERNSDFALEQIYNIIDSRYKAKKPLIVTTNLSLEEMKTTTDLAKKRIYSRIFESCSPIIINNKNIRDLKAEENLKTTKEFFNN